MSNPSARTQNVLSGAIALLLLISAIALGVKASFGAFDGGYLVAGSFDAAGQGLLPGSDVKVRGVNIGEVRSIELRDGRAEISLRIHDGETIPRDAVARIRAKTLFGEKFVDLDLTETDESAGPFLHDGDRLRNTEGGFELEAVLADAYPVLQAIDGRELLTVISNLAEGGRGLGESINRSIGNGGKVTRTFAENSDKTERFLRDFAAVSDQLADSADDLVGIADAGNVVLPVLNDHEAELVTILQQTGRLSNDVADLLLANTPFVDAALGDGSKAVQVLYDRRTQVMPLVIGLRQYIQTLTEVIRIQVGDGTLMGAVKGLLGSALCSVVPCAPPSNTLSASSPDRRTGATPTPAPPRGNDPGPSDLAGLLRRVLGA